MDKAEFDLHAKVEQRHWWFTGRRHIMQQLLRQLSPPGEGHTVVDIGCGTGANIGSLAEEYKAVGVDASDYAIEHAQKTFPNVEFHCTTDSAVLAEIVSTANVVTIMDVLEHVPDDYEMLSQLLSASREGAHFLITVPANLSLWSKHDEVFGHYRRYDADQLAAVWAGLDVECRLLSYFNARLYPVVRFIRGRKKKREQGTDAHESDLKTPMAPLNVALHSVFAGESRKLARALRHDIPMPYKQGVSLLAVLRRGADEIAPRSRPEDAARDYFNPVSKQYLNSEEVSHV